MGAFSFMDIQLKRTRKSKVATFGSIFIDGKFVCYSLEDIVRKDPNPGTPENEAKVYAETAIPAGTYKVQITFSQRFQKKLPILIEVPGFTGIRIHKGNRSKDTMGCILVGMAPSGDDWLGLSTEAWTILQPYWDRIERGEEATITITDTFAEAL